MNAAIACAMRVVLAPIRTLAAKSGSSNCFGVTVHLSRRSARHYLFPIYFIYVFAPPLVMPGTNWAANYNPPRNHSLDQGTSLRFHSCVTTVAHSNSRLAEPTHTFAVSRQCRMKTSRPNSSNSIFCNFSNLPIHTLGLRNPPRVKSGGGRTTIVHAGGISIP